MATLEHEQFRFPDQVTKFVNDNKLDVVSITHNKNDNVFVLFYTEKTLAKQNEELKVKPISPKGAKEKFVLDLDPRMIEAVNNLLAKNASSHYITLKAKEIEKEYHRICELSDKPARAVYKENQMDFEDIFRKAGWKVSYDQPGWDESYDPFYQFEAQR